MLISFARRNKNIKIDIRVTPYQIEDEDRPWIRREEMIFSTTLQAWLGPEQVRRKVFSPGEKTILGHFRVLDTFEELPLL